MRNRLITSFICLLSLGCSSPKKVDPLEQDIWELGFEFPASSDPPAHIKALRLKIGEYTTPRRLFFIESECLVFRVSKDFSELQCGNPLYSISIKIDGKADFMHSAVYSHRQLGLPGPTYLMILGVSGNQHNDLCSTKALFFVDTDGDNLVRQEDYSHSVELPDFFPRLAKSLRGTAYLCNQFGNEFVRISDTDGDHVPDQLDKGVFCKLPEEKLRSVNEILRLGEYSFVIGEEFIGHKFPRFTISDNDGDGIADSVQAMR